MKNLLFFIVLFFFIKFTFSQLVPDFSNLNSELMYNSLLRDGLTYFYDENELEAYSKQQQSNSKLIKGFFDIGNNTCEYEVELIVLNISAKTEYKLLHFKNDCSIDTYFRLSGYLENDFIHFYERILKYYLPKRKVSKQIKEWQNQDSTFAKVNFDELIYSVNKNNNKVPSMISHVTVLHMSGIPFSTSIYREEEKKVSYLTDNIYGYFSNRPFQGHLPSNLSFKKRCIFR